MADEPIKISASISYIELPEAVGRLAVQYAEGPDPHLSLVANTVINVAELGVEAMLAAAGKGGNLDPYLKFDFGSSVASAHELLSHGDADAKKLASLLIAQENAVRQSRESFDAAIATAGIKPKTGPNPNTGTELSG